MLHYPNPDPVAFSLFGRDVRWYSVMYMLGILYLFFFFRRAIARGRLKMSTVQLEGLMLVGVVSMMLGARVFYVLVYNWDYYAADPSRILNVAQGGLAFHGALIGIGLGALFYARIQKIPYLNLTDHICAAVPFGIGCGRIGNFINGELWGRVTDVPWGMVFDHAGPEARHPSQIYESFLEGWVMLAFMLWLYRRRPSPGVQSGVYLITYGVFRIIGEQFRQPDAQLGLLAWDLSMGQILSLLMIAFGSGTLLVVRKLKSAPST